MSDRQDLQLMMGEMAAQADVQSVCAEVERQIEGMPWAQNHWRQLLQENDTFRNELGQVAVPAELESSLLTIASPNQNTASPKPNRAARVVAWSMTLAAVVVIVAFFVVSNRNQNNMRLQTVAVLAVDNHLNHQEDHGVTSQPNREQLAAELAAVVKFDVVLPQINKELQLVGGRNCKLRTHTVAFSLWTNGEQNFSLFQFKTDDFGIPKINRPKLVHSVGPAGDKHLCGAWIWTDQTNGFVLVGDPDCDIAELRPNIAGQ